MASSNATAPTDFEMFFLFLGGAIEFLTNFVGIPLSIVNLCLVARTSVIHPNMKAILIFQSFTILLRAFCRLTISLFKFILWNPIGAESMQFFPALAKMYYFGIYTRNFVPHVLIIERILATLFVRSYEKCRGHLFTILWMPFALTVAIYLAFTTTPQSDRPLANLITTAIQLVIGAVELAIFVKLCQYNSKIYRKVLQNEGYHCLSLRYQLSENIRIGKQLMPPLWLYLCTLICSAAINWWSFLKLPQYYQVFNFLASLNSVNGFLIELFIITCHPFLKRDIGHFWHYFGATFCHVFRPFLPNNRRISDQQGATNGCACSTAAGGANTVGIAQRDLISGKALIDQSKPDEHFAMLKKAWERKPVKHQQNFNGIDL